MNDFDIKCINKEIWSESGKLYFKGIGPWGTITKDKSADAIEIDVISLDDLLETELKYCEHLDFIKMDIEGSEVEALTGAGKMLKHFHYPPIFVEANAWTLALVDNKTTTDLIRVAEKHGYNVYRMQEGVWKKYNTEAFWDILCTDYMLVHPLNEKEYITLSKENYQSPNEEESAKNICGILSKLVEFWGREEIAGLPYQHGIAVACSLHDFPKLADREDISKLIAKLKKISIGDALMSRVLQ